MDEIQRYHPFANPQADGSVKAECGQCPYGDYVKHADHLSHEARAVKEAKIEALTSVRGLVTLNGCIERLEQRIAELEKEL